MSRIGNAPIELPKGVELSVTDNVLSVKGAKGELTQVIDPAISVKQEEGIITLDRASESKDHKAKHGLYRALIANMVEGVTNGYKIELELVGVGYRAKASGQQLELLLGFSHPIVFELPKEVKLETTTEKGKSPLITLESHDKQLVGQCAAKIRAFRRPEPYKGKGVRFKGEYIRRKAGKAAAK